MGNGLYEAMGRGAPTKELVSRLLPGREDEFVFETIKAHDGRDVFEVESKHPQVIVRGNTPVAQAAGLHWYLKHVCRSHVSWNAVNLTVPSPLPHVAPMRKVSPYEHRYYFNYCTFSYTAAFWDWDRWNTEIDWMALHGINLPLAVTGQEAIWQRVYENMGLSSEEILNFFVGPAHLPFGWMGCMDGWGGPLRQSWIDDHLQLGKQIVARERSLGMNPVLQGFTGHVPKGLVQRHNGCHFHELTWGDFPPTYLLDPTDPLFHQVASAFYKEQTKQFGPTNFYATDTFIEMIPPSKDVGFLRDMGAAIYKSMTDVNPDAIWVMQGWVAHFRREFWQPAQFEAFLSAVPDDKMLVLDLFAEENPVWARTDAFHGKSWAWCMLHNFGGRPELQGRMPEVARGAAEALRNPGGGNLRGIGLTMEAIEQNPVMYELMTDVGWEIEPIDTRAWVREYATYRYGQSLAAAQQAWDILRNTVYSGDATRPLESIVCRHPHLNKLGRTVRYRQDTDSLCEAWRLLLQCADTVGSTETYRYDVVDVGRQVLSDLAGFVHEDLVSSFNEGAADAFRDHGTTFLGIMKDLDDLLATVDAFHMERWLNKARRWGNDAEECAHYEWNARNLVTIWGGPTAYFRDYARRHWAGLVGDFYLPRWERFITDVSNSLAAGKSMDFEAFKTDLLAWEISWTKETGPVGPQQPGDSIVTAQRLYEKYAPLVWRKTGVQ